MNLLGIVRDVCGSMGLAQPGSVVNNPDPRIIQMLSLLNKFCDDLLIRGAWQAVRAESVVTTLAESDDFGDMDSLCPNGYHGIIPGTMFNRSEKRHIEGSIGAQEWQRRQAAGFGIGTRAFRIFNNRLRFTTPVPQGHIVAWEYYSGYFVASSSVSFKPYWTADTDVCRLPDALPRAYLVWAYKKEKGLDYGEDFAFYERQINLALTRDEPKQSVRLDCPASPVAGIVVPVGNWNVSS